MTNRRDFDRRRGFVSARKALKKMFDGSLEGDPLKVRPEDIMWAMREIRPSFSMEDLGNKHLAWLRDDIFELMDPGELEDHPDAEERGALLLRAEQLTPKQKADFVLHVTALHKLLVRGE